MVKAVSSLFVSFVLLGLSAVCQLTLTPAQQQDLNTFRLYDEFFSRVQTVERLADRAEASGFDKSHTSRKHIQNQVGLNDKEYAAIRAVALESSSQLNSNRAEIKSAFRTFHAAHPNDPVPDDLKRQRLQAGQRRIRIVSDHIGQLKAKLGDAAFQQLDQWVRTSMHSNPTTIGGK